VVSCHSAELFHIAQIDSSISTHKVLVNVNVGKNLIVAKPQLPVELVNVLATARSNFVNKREGQYWNWRESGTATS
jgi:hypothetical protein